MPRTPIPLPMNDALVDIKTGKMTDPWVDYFLGLTLLLSQSPQRICAKEFVAQAASMSPTPLPAGLTGNGLYRLTYALRVVIPATTSSSIAVAFGWLDEGNSCSIVDTALTLNTVHAVATNTVLARCDAATALTVSTIYASSGATPMKYDLDVVVEAIA